VVRVTHWINTVAFAGLLVSGVAILLAHPRLYWGETGNRESPSLIDLPLPFVLALQTGWGRSLHFLSAWICILNGLLYILSGLIMQHFRKHLLPAKTDLMWPSLQSAIANHFHPKRLKHTGAYNVLQRLIYMFVVFVLFPLMIWTGFAMSPAVTSVLPFFASGLGGQQSARTIHFFVANSLLLFLCVHIAMVSLTGLTTHFRAMITGRGGAQRKECITTSISRRKIITRGALGLTAASGMAVAARMAGKYGLIPPDHSGIYGAGETLTFASQRLLTSCHSLAREFDRGQVSKLIPIKTKAPKVEAYKLLQTENFAGWRLEVAGLVSRPSFISLAELKMYPSTTQITHLACEEGWSFIAEWTGVRLSYVLNVVGALSHAKYVVFYSFDGAWDSIDMADAWHPQTLLAYRMNGEELSHDHGAPVRLRVARQLGYKSLKWLSRILVTDSVKHLGNGLGSDVTELGYSWYAGI
jgi:DMSO/TMAO reductase YedYZ molybdopterin-dependent catalytic subunit/thiosulfate reductase cytochrome b subunit